MDQAKPGQRFKSAVCSAEIMVVKISDNPQLTCGGLPLVDVSDDTNNTADGNAEHMTGCEVGKRYTNQSETTELLCIKSGDGGLGADGNLPTVKGSKKLPSSD